MVVGVAVLVGVAVAAGGVPIPTVGTVGVALEPSGGTGTEGTTLGSNPGAVGATVGIAIVGATVGILLGNATGTVGTGVVDATTVTVGSDVTAVGTTTVGATTVGATTVGATTVGRGGTSIVGVASGGTTGTPGIVGNGSAVTVGSGRAGGVRVASGGTTGALGIVGSGNVGALGITLGTTAMVVGKAGIRVATTVGAEAPVLAIVVATLPGNAATVATADAP